MSFLLCSDGHVHRDHSWNTVWKRRIVVVALTMATVLSVVVVVVLVMTAVVVVVVVEVVAGIWMVVIAVVVVVVVVSHRWLVTSKHRNRRETILCHIKGWRIRHPGWLRRWSHDTNGSLW